MGRANLPRLVGIAAFYAVEMVKYHGLNLGFLQMTRIVERPFHLAVMLLTLDWISVGVGRPALACSAPSCHS